MSWRVLLHASELFRTLAKESTCSILGNEYASWRASGGVFHESILCALIPQCHFSVCPTAPPCICLSTCLSICLSRCHASFFLEACHLNVEKGWHSGRWPPLSNPAASQPLRHDSSSSSLPFPLLEALLVSFTREIPNSQHHPPKGTE